MEGQAIWKNKRRKRGQGRQCKILGQLALNAEKDEEEIVLEELLHGTFANKVGRLAVAMASAGGWAHLHGCLARDGGETLQTGKSKVLVR